MAAHPRPPKAELAALYRKKKSYRLLAMHYRVGRTTMGRWLHFYGIKAISQTPNPCYKPYFCKCCGATEPANFGYGRKAVCRACSNRPEASQFFASRSRRRSMIKYAAVQAKGGCCQICGYRKNMAALQFHHPNRDNKHEGWSRLFLQCAHSPKHADTLATELHKCILLCANCHAEHHHAELHMPICVHGPMLQYLADWVGKLHAFFYESPDGGS